MDKDIKLLIVPDVHGRDFWKAPVKENLDKEIIFLGDYLDPYQSEGIYPRDALVMFYEILELAKTHSNIALLLGNHDAGYCLSPRICECRHDWENHEEIRQLFENNLDLFNLAEKRVINRKHFLFTHAGVNPAWVQYEPFFGGRIKPTAKQLNRLLHNPQDADFRGLVRALETVSYYRGGYEGYGSLLWADVREFYKNNEIRNKKTIQVVGHTMLNNVALRFGDIFYCLDCQQVFYIDNKGIIRYYNTDDEITKVK